MSDNIDRRQKRWRQACLLYILIWSLLLASAPHPKAAHAMADHAFSHQPLSTQTATTASEGVITGRVWKDVNQDGLYQLDEPFLPFTLVELYLLSATSESTPQINTTPLLTATTTITGSYAFRGLMPATYLLEFTTRGSMYPTSPDQGTDETRDSDIFTTGMVTYGRSSPVILASGDQHRVLDAGFVQAAQATVYVYDDTNRDNNRQLSEPVVLGAVVILSNSAGREVSRLVVDQRGAALFPDLPPGDYAVTVWPPEGYSEDPRAAVVLSLAPGASVRLSAPVAATPKVIELAAFTIAVENNELVIRWVTVFEQQTYGYRLLRSRDVSAAATEELTAAIIASKGAQGGVYEVRLPYRPAYDGPATAMEFWLVEYEVTGKENRYGPFYVTSPLARKTFLPLVVTVP
ncbi:MAG: hypothetical protein DYG89_13625 [Caldilinea sp. CFX5]|nr:hypothetical protein [Caldilinea sp. CFX5]